MSDFFVGTFLAAFGYGQLSKEFIIWIINFQGDNYCCLMSHLDSPK
ncbi:hypothetical protein HU200_021991 [Digitaria exilis]|uniref:Uncharacterized protein n=1 Tax=Digitaria exilis TaxID=1010633 RepID=A0A835EXK9_9POAL|nr:hypothetical protein HU200_021991 [Digitaria exilis]